MVTPPWLKPLNAPERIPGWLCAAANPRCGPAGPLEGVPPWKAARFTPPWLKSLRFTNVLLWEM